MSVNIQAPSLRPPRVSLLTSAEIIDIPGDRWWGHIEYQQLSGNPSVGSQVAGFTSELDSDDIFILPICPASPEEAEKVQWPRGATRTAIPFAIYATESCSSFGGSASEIINRAKQKLTVNESWTIENELWFGNATTNDFLTSPDTIDLGTSLHPLTGFALVDAAVAADRSDGRGMIYVTARGFDLLQQYTLFRREGNVWFSPLDNIVVPMRGVVEGESTDSAIYGHPGPLQIVRSDIFTIPETEAQLEVQMNRHTNDLWAVAERVVSYIIPTDNVYGVGIDLALAASTSGGGGGGGDASAANQVTANNLLTDIESAVDGLEAALTAPTIVAEAVTGDEAIASANWLRGWSVWNTAAGITEVTIHNGTTSGGAVLVRFRLAEDESYTNVLPVRLPAPDGVHFEVVSGTAIGTIFYEA